MAKKRSARRPASNDKTAKSKPEGAAAYFLSLTVRNLRCFGDEGQTLDLSDGNGRPAQWTVILGNNATGKTTLLQALVVPGDIPRMFWQWAESRSTSDSPREFLASAGASLVRIGALCSEFTGRVHLGPELRNALAENGLAHTFGLYLRGGEFSCDETTLPPECCAYGAGRRIGVAAVGDKTRSDPTETLFSDRAELRNAEEWLLQADYAAAKTRKDVFRRRLDRVKDVLVSVLPDVSDVRIVEPSKTRPVPRVEFQTPFGWLPFDSLSYGYQTMVGWMVDFASRMVERYPDSPDPLAEPAVVLVDEIDLHLHPKWQREIMGYLTERFPNTQFIVTAHSPLIVQAAPSVNANIAVLRREGDRVVIDNDVESIRGWRVDQILTSDLYELPTARPAEFDKPIQKRLQILGKAKLTEKDRKELEVLDRQLEELPAGSTAAEARELLKLARETADLLKQHQGRGE